MDTDGDGISDYDELSAEQFAALARFNDFFPGCLIDGTASKQYGTDPTRVDTDGDKIPDRVELLVGWTVVRDDGSVEHVFSDPTRGDTDGDGLPDDQELMRLTDPGDPLGGAVRALEDAAARRGVEGAWCGWIDGDRVHGKTARCVLK
jgi:Bacterial TSP3 repeat